MTQTQCKQNNGQTYSPKVRQRAMRLLIEHRDSYEVRRKASAFLPWRGAAVASSHNDV